MVKENETSRSAYKENGIYWEVSYQMLRGLVTKHGGILYELNRNDLGQGDCV